MCLLNAFLLGRSCRRQLSAPHEQVDSVALGRQKKQSGDRQNVGRKWCREIGRKREG